MVVIERERVILETKDTIFHKIIRREIAADIVFEDDSIIAFKDIQPISPTHILIVPKKDLPSLSVASADDAQLLGHMLLAAKQIAESEGIAEDGYRVVINSGVSAGQAVFQLHMHLVGGRVFSWPPG